MNPIPNRIVIYPKDVMNITGRAPSTSRKLLARIRKHYGKERGGFITIEEFCAFTRLKPENITRFLK